MNLSGEKDQLDGLRTELVAKMVVSVTYGFGYVFRNLQLKTFFSRLFYQLETSLLGPN